MGWKLKTPPVLDPITLEEAKAHLRVKQSNEDGLITGFIKAATKYTEEYLTRAIMTQTWELYIDKFIDSIEIPIGPVQSVQSVKYYDSNNVLQILSEDEYTIDDSSNPGWIVRNSSSSWPSISTGINSVVIEVIVGEEEPPLILKQAIFLLIGNWYFNREATSDERSYELPLAFHSLLAIYKKPALA